MIKTKPLIKLFSICIPFRAPEFYPLEKFAVRETISGHDFFNGRISGTEGFYFLVGKGDFLITLAFKLHPSGNFRMLVHCTGFYPRPFFCDHYTMDSYFFMNEYNRRIITSRMRSIFPKLDPLEVLHLPATELLMHLGYFSQSAFYPYPELSLLHLRADFYEHPEFILTYMKIQDHLRNGKKAMDIMDNPRFKFAELPQFRFIKAYYQWVEIRKKGGREYERVEGLGEFQKTADFLYEWFRSQLDMPELMELAKGIKIDLIHPFTYLDYRIALFQTQLLIEDESSIELLQSTINELIPSGGRHLEQYYYFLTPAIRHSTSACLEKESKELFWEAGFMQVLQFDNLGRIAIRCKDYKSALFYLNESMAIQFQFAATFASYKINKNTYVNYLFCLKMTNAWEYGIRLREFKQRYPMLKLNKLFRKLKAKKEYMRFKPILPEDVQNKVFSLAHPLLRFNPVYLMD